jgi:hypothetical protein
MRQLWPDETASPRLRKLWFLQRPGDVPAEDDGLISKAPKRFCASFTPYF